MANIALVTSDTGHASVTLNRDMLLGLSHTVTLIGDSNIAATDFSPYDVIVAFRNTQANAATIAAELRAIVDSGIPILIGMAPHGPSGIMPTYNAVCTEMKLTGLITWVNSTYVSTGAGTTIEIIDTSHDITSGLPIGQLPIFTVSKTSVGVMDSREPSVGVVLANGHPGTGTGNNPALFAIESGTNDLLEQPIGARIVIFGSLWAADAYTPEAVDLFDRIVNWLLDAGAPSAVETEPTLALALEVQPAVTHVAEVEFALALSTEVDATAIAPPAQTAEAEPTLALALEVQPQVTHHAEAEFVLALAAEAEPVSVDATVTEEVEFALALGLEAAPAAVSQVSADVEFVLALGLEAEAQTDAEPIPYPSILANLRDLAYYGRGATEPDDATNLSAIAYVGISATASLRQINILRAIAQIGVGGMASLQQDHNLRALARIGVGGQDRYSGPGTGLVVGDPASTDITELINRLREGDDVPVLLSWAGSEAMSGYIRVLGRGTTGETDRQSIEPWFQPTPDPELTATLARGGNPVVKPQHSGNLFREMREQARRIRQQRDRR